MLDGRCQMCRPSAPLCKGSCRCQRLRDCQKLKLFCRLEIRYAKKSFDMDINFSLQQPLRGGFPPHLPKHRGGKFCTNPWLPLTRELSSEARLRERKGKAFMYLKPFSPSVTTYAVTPSRLPPRSVLLLRRGVRRTPAPQTPWRQRFVQTEGLF